MTLLAPLPHCCSLDKYRVPSKVARCWLCQWKFITAASELFIWTAEVGGAGAHCCCLGMVYWMLLCSRWPGVALSVITAFITAVSFLQNCLLGLQKWVELVPNIYSMLFCVSSSIILYWMVKEIYHGYVLPKKLQTPNQACSESDILPSSSQKYLWTYTFEYAGTE